MRDIACQALGSIAKHDEELASRLVHLGTINCLVTALHEPEISIKSSAAQCLADIVNHSSELSHVAVDSGCIFVLAKNLEVHDPKPKVFILKFFLDNSFVCDIYFFRKVYLHTVMPRFNAPLI